MPALFVGHGNPMNSLVENDWTRSWARLGRSLPRPRAILAVSAHWYVPGTRVTDGEAPPTIHDFGGFPRALYELRYGAPGEPALAREVQRLLAPAPVVLDPSWGLDHGTWSVLRHMYPAADVPVLQLSLNMIQGPEFHFALGEKLKHLRRAGILIVGSGNIVHNLRRIDFADDARPFDWAIEFDAWVKERLQNRDYNAIVHDATRSSAGKLSIPTPDHWYPFLYTLGAADETDALRFEHEGIENASISMRCLTLGAS